MTHPRQPAIGGFGRLWSAVAISSIGDGVMLTALPLLTASLTRDPLLVAGTAFAQQLPWLLFSLPSGALVDRLDRRRVMGLVDLARAALVGALAALVLVDAAPLALVYAAAFLLGCAETLFDNASQAILPRIVPHQRLEPANARIAAAQITANDLAGPPLGAVLFAAFAALPILLDAASFAAAAVLVLALPRSPGAAPVGGPVGVATRSRRSARALARGLGADIAEGLRWLYRHRLLRALALMLGAMTLVHTAAVAILVLFASDVLGLDELGYGLLFSAAAVGGLVGSAVATRVARRLGAGAALVLCILVSGGSLLATGLTSSPVVVGAMFVLYGLSAVIWNVITVSLRQAIVPDRLLGRVNSAYRLLGWGPMALGALVGGALAGALGLRAPFLIGGGALLALGLTAIPLLGGGAVAAARAAGSDRRGSEHE